MNETTVKAEIIHKIKKMLIAECYPKSYTMETSVVHNFDINVSSALAISIHDDTDVAYGKVRSLYGNKHIAKQFPIHDPEFFGKIVVYAADTLGRIVRVRPDLATGVWIEILDESSISGGTYSFSREQSTYQNNLGHVSEI